MFIFILFFNCALIFVFIDWTSAVRSTVNFKQHGSHRRRRIFHEVWMISSTNIFFKEKYTIKQIDRSTKIKIIFCYVMSIELAGGGDKFYFFYTDWNTFFKSISRFKVIYPWLFCLVKVFKLTKLLISNN